MLSSGISKHTQTAITFIGDKHAEFLQEDDLERMYLRVKEILKNRERSGIACSYAEAFQLMANEFHIPYAKRGIHKEGIGKIRSEIGKEIRQRASPMPTAAEHQSWQARHEATKDFARAPTPLKFTQNKKGQLAFEL